MEMVYADVELINSGDVAMARRNLIGQEEIRRSHVTMTVDIRAFTMLINENIQKQMGFSFLEVRPVQLANGKIVDCNVVGPIGVKFANRSAICSAYVLPDDSMPVLGGIPMLEMDVLVDRGKHKLVVNPKHPEGAVMRL